MNSNRRCSHCGELGHNSRTCQEGAVKLFGVTLSQDIQSDLPRSASAGNLARPPTSPDSASLAGREGSGPRCRASPLGRAASTPRTEDPEVPTCPLVDRLGPSVMGPSTVSGPTLAEGLGHHRGRGAQDPAEGREEEEEGRSEYVHGGAADEEADGTRLLQTDERMLSGEGDGYLSDNGGGPNLTASASKERKKGVPWTEEEHRLFLLGLSKLGKGDWRGISRNFVQTRTPTQVASHAQKFFIRQNNINKRKRRASLLDISTDSINADTGMLRSQSTPSLPSLAEDLKTGSRSSNGMAASGSGLSAFPLPGTPSLQQPLPGSPGLSPPFGLNSPETKTPDSKLFDHTPLQKAQDFMLYPPPPTPSLYSHPHLYPGHLSTYQQDPAGFLSTGFRPPNPYMDFGRSQSYPVVAAPGVVTEVSSLSRPSSLPTLGSPMPVAGGPGASAMEGVWPPAGAGDPSAAPYWSQLYGGAKPAAQDAQALAAMDPALRHRLGHEMMMEMMGQQLSHRMAADFSRAQASTVAGAPGVMGLPGEIDAVRRAKVARASGLHGAVMEMSPVDVPLAQASPFIPPLLSSSPQSYGPNLAASVSDSSVAVAAAAAAAAAAAVAASPGGAPQHGIPPPWYMGPAYNAWMTQYGASFRPPPTGLMQSYSWRPMPPSAEACTSATPLTGQEVNPGSPFVLRPTAVVPTAPMVIPTARASASEGTEMRDSEQEPAAALVMLSKGLEVTSPEGKGKAAEDVGRVTPRTLQLFDVSERPSAFHPQQCPNSRLSPESGDLVKSPISVP